MAALTLEERIAKLQEKQAQLKAQEKSLRAKQSAEKRKKRYPPKNSHRWRGRICPGLSIAG